jgi:tRNA-2-methylthio-N6-dimethylallyladenosine synthase
MQTVYIKTHGCQMNTYDSSRILDLLKKTHNLNPVNTPEEADLILLNTCSIREKAQEKVFSELGVFRSLKEKNPAILIGVGGCVASQEGEDILKRAPYVDVIFGPQTLHRLPNLIANATKTRSPQVDISFPLIEKFDSLPLPTAHGPAAYVSIMEGCSKYCTYCVVPYTRGEEVSRAFDDVLHEVHTLAQQGVREITLLGQNVNAYRGKMHDGAIADLALTITYIAEFEDILRIRFMTSHPVEFSDRLIQAYRDIPKLSSHLHLPVQSGSDRILSLMKRGHTALQYREKIQKLREARPGINITSDFIIGFPGETEEDFLATLQLVKEIQFDQSYSFIYSPRPGTPAANLRDNVPLVVKKERLQILQTQLSEQTVRISQQMLGTEQIVLVTGPSKKSPEILSGKTDNNRFVNFVGDAPIGSLTTVEITGATNHILHGKWVA